jgi:hypothetical protein
MDNEQHIRHQLLPIQCCASLPGAAVLAAVLCVCRYSELLRHSGEAPVAVRRCETVEEVLREADVSAAHSSISYLLLLCCSASFSSFCFPLCGICVHSV